MVAIKHFENEQGRVIASVFRDTEHGILMNVFSRSQTGPEDLKKVMAFSFEQIKRKGLTAWISDISQLEGVNASTVEAARQSISKKMKNTPLHKWAFVSHKDPSNERSQIVEAIKCHGVRVKIFASAAKAVEWLVVPKLDETVWDDVPVLTF